MKVSRKITTQHSQLIFCVIFIKDNTEPNYGPNVKVTQRTAKTPIVFTVELSRFIYPIPVA